jgi:hypothetical protein
MKQILKKTCLNHGELKPEDIALTNRKYKNKPGYYLRCRICTRETSKAIYYKYKDKVSSPLPTKEHYIKTHIDRFLYNKR